MYFQAWFDSESSSGEDEDELAVEGATGGSSDAKIDDEDTDKSSSSDGISFYLCCEFTVCLVRSKIRLRFGYVHTGSIQNVVLQRNKELLCCLIFVILTSIICAYIEFRHVSVVQESIMIFVFK